MIRQDKKLKVPTPALANNPQTCCVDTSEWPTFPVFTAARLVCRERLHVIGDNSVLREIDSFQDELSESLTLTAAYKMSDGSLRLLQYLADHKSKTKDWFLRRWDVNAVTGQAAARGDMRTLKWVAESYLPGEFLILKWVWENYRSSCYWGGVELAGAIRNQHQDVVDWLRANVTLRPECAEYLIKPAAECGNLGIVQWLLENYEFQSVDALNAAALKGQWEVTRWFLDNLSREDLDAAVQSGYIYLCPAEYGDLDMLKFVFGRVLVQEPVEVLEVAAEHGHLNIIKWLVEQNGVEDAGGTFQRAADKGHLNVLMYLHEKVPDHCSDSLLDGAAHAGNLEVVQWLHENTRACCTLYAMDGAAANGHLEMVQWLHTHHSEGCTSLAMDWAAVNGHLEVVKWLHENQQEGCRPDTMTSCARRGHLDMVKWLHANIHQDFDHDGAMDAAAARGHLDVVEWFHDNRDEGCISFHFKVEVRLSSFILTKITTDASTVNTELISPDAPPNS